MSPRSTVIAVALVLTMITGAGASDQVEVTAAGLTPEEAARVIELEMVGIGRFLLDGEEARVLRVAPGEVVVFRVDNTSGQQLGFEVGPEERICDPARSPRQAIPAWSEGVRELTWKVPAATRNWRWGHRGRYCYLGEFSAAGESAEDRTAGLPRVTGPLRVHLRRSELWLSFDVDFKGSTSAVAWREPGDPWRALYLSRADDITLVDFATEQLAIDVDDHAVVVCGSDVVMAYLQRPPDDERRLWLTRLPGDGSPVTSSEVRAPVGGGGDIDVACNDERAYVAWSERVDGEWHPFVRSATLPDLELSPILDAGPAKGKAVAVAATDEHGLLAWKPGKHIRLARIQPDADDEAKLAITSARTFAKGGSEPKLDADGERVALAFDRGNLGLVLTSRDGGFSFDQRSRFDRRSMDGTPREFDSLAIEGRDVVATMVVYYGGDAWDRHRLRSRDGGRTWTTSRIDDPVAAIPNDGFLVTREGVKVAEAYTDGEYAQAWDLRVRRER